MSMITELVKRLRKHADTFEKSWSAVDGIVKDYGEAADVIEELSAKLQAANMERSSQYYNGGWIPVSERLPDDHDWYVIVVKEKSTGYQYIPRIASYNHDNCWSIIDTEDADKDWLDDLECVAWMPLPEPYKQEVEE